MNSIMKQFNLLSLLIAAMLFACSLNAQSTGCGKFKLVGHWTFEGNNPLKDLKGNFGDLQLIGGAKIDKGALDVGNNAYAKGTGFNGVPFKKKTLVAWAKLDALTPQAGSVLTIDNTNKDEFDGIVFGEKEKSKWMAGSNFHKRTNNPRPGFQETKTGELVKMAITYGDTAGNAVIKIYRNGQLIGDYLKGALPEFGKTAEVIFGTRHTLGNAPRSFIDAHIEEARIYDGVLCQKDIQQLEMESSSPVTVFQHYDYRGKTQSFGKGYHAGYLAIGNDVISSVKVKKGWRVILYEHGPTTGRALTLTSDTPNLGKYKFNDIVSNLRVERIPNDIYGIGDEHPCGGIVVSIDKTGKKGMIAAKKDLYEENVYKTYDAVKAMGNGWSVPNPQTVELLYQNLKDSDQLGLQKGWYWTSNQVSNGYWAAQNFADGKTGNRFFGERQYCRPVKAIDAKTTCQTARSSQGTR